MHPDDITDSSVVLAGPGNLKSRSSKLTSLIEVIVGCEGRLWLKSAPVIHQLKQQAKDGTITEVLRLPLVGWRVKTETRSLLRKKRQDDSKLITSPLVCFKSISFQLIQVAAIMSITNTKTTTIPIETSPNIHWEDIR